MIDASVLMSCFIDCNKAFDKVRNN